MWKKWQFSWNHALHCVERVFDGVRLWAAIVKLTLRSWPLKFKPLCFGCVHDIKSKVTSCASPDWKWQTSLTTSYHITAHRILYTMFMWRGFFSVSIIYLLFVFVFWIRILNWEWERERNNSKNNFVSIVPAIKKNHTYGDREWKRKTLAD